MWGGFASGQNKTATLITPERFKFCHKGFSVCFINVLLNLHAVEQPLVSLSE